MCDNPETELKETVTIEKGIYQEKAMNLLHIHKEVEDYKEEKRDKERRKAERKNNT